MIFIWYEFVDEWNWKNMSDISNISDRIGIKRNVSFEMIFVKYSRLIIASIGFRRYVKIYIFVYIVTYHISISAVIKFPNISVYQKSVTEVRSMIIFSNMQRFEIFFDDFRPRHYLKFHVYSISWCRMSIIVINNRCRIRIILIWKDRDDITISRNGTVHPPRGYWVSVSKFVWTRSYYCTARRWATHFLWQTAYAEV